MTNVAKNWRHVAVRNRDGSNGLTTALTPPEVISAMERWCETMGESKSQFIRTAIRERLTALGVEI